MDGGLSGVLGTHIDLEGVSPSASLMEVKASEAQGRHREVGSEGSVEQGYEPTYRNWILRREGRMSWPVAAKSKSIKDRHRISSGCVPKVNELTPGDLGCCPLTDWKNREVLRSQPRSPQRA